MTDGQLTAPPASGASRPHLQVTCAIIEQHGLILAAQRGETMAMALKWEFPGGKIMAGESPEHCLRRELHEEMGLVVEVGPSLPPATHGYPECIVTLHPFVCRIVEGEVILHEHRAVVWFSIDQVPELDWAEADIPVLAHYRRWLTFTAPSSGSTPGGETEMTDTTHILAGDIGGTKTNLAIYADGDTSQALFQASFASRDYADLETMTAEFLDRYGLAVQRAAFGVAGPVLNGRAKITKLAWQVDAEAFKACFALAEVVVVNDLVATACGIAGLPASDLICLNQGTPSPHGPLAVIAPGTGLGEAMMFWDGQRYRAQPTEGGHALFSPATRQQLALADFVLARQGRAESFDLMASGRGLPLIYDFLRQDGTHSEPPWLAKALAEAEDPAPVITNAALHREPSDPLCLDSIRLLVEIIAVESANLALKTLSTGGLFIGGGIPPKLKDLFHERFMDSFVRPGPMQGILAAMPVHLITNAETALLGAARLGMGLA